MANSIIRQLAVKTSAGASSATTYDIGSTASNVSFTWGTAPSAASDVSNVQGALDYLNSNLTPIGTIITGTNVSGITSIPNQGAITKCGSITLTKGAWILQARGYCPLNKTADPRTYLGATALYFALQTPSQETTDKTVLMGTVALSASWIFNLTVPCWVNRASTNIDFKITNWESNTTPYNSNYRIKAIKISQLVSLSSSDFDNL